MWRFAVGLYLVKLSGGELRLAAIYGFCGGGCVLLFGGLIGDWVDRNRRLKGSCLSSVVLNVLYNLHDIINVGAKLGSSFAVYTHTHND